LEEEHRYAEETERDEERGVLGVEYMTPIDQLVWERFLGERRTEEGSKGMNRGIRVYLCENLESD